MGSVPVSIVIYKKLGPLMMLVKVSPLVDIGWPTFLLVHVVQVPTFHIYRRLN
jgi:hypothetical protein